MILSSIVSPLVEATGALSFHQLHGYIPEPQESHRLFGAGFLFLGTLMLVETFAGKVWHRNAVRTQLFPAALMILGQGMLIVTIIEPNDRVQHLVIGLVLVIAAVFERRYRLREIPRRTADWAVVPALVAGGLEIGVLHSHGAITSQSFIAHMTFGATAMAMAPIRVSQSRHISSAFWQALLALMVVALGFQLLGFSH
jgi:hypothetical protein